MAFGGVWRSCNRRAWSAAIFPSSKRQSRMPPGCICQMTRLAHPGLGQDRANPRPDEFVTRGLFGFAAFERRGGNAFEFFARAFQQFPAGGGLAPGGVRVAAQAVAPPSRFACGPWCQGATLRLPEGRFTVGGLSRAGMIMLCLLFIFAIIVPVGPLALGTVVLFKFRHGETPPLWLHLLASCLAIVSALTLYCVPALPSGESLDFHGDLSMLGSRRQAPLPYRP